MINFIECFAKIYWAQINCVPFINEIFNYPTDGVNSMITAYNPFLKPNWLFWVEKNAQKHETIS